MPCSASSEGISGYPTKRVWSIAPTRISMNSTDRICGIGWRATTTDGVFSQDNNPVVRHTPLRRRRALEEAGLMKPVAVDLHPKPDEPDRRARAFFGESGRAVRSTMALTKALPPPMPTRQH